MAEEIPDEMLDEFVAARTPAEGREKYREFNRIDGIDSIRVGFCIDQDLENQYRTMEILAGSDP